MEKEALINIILNDIKEVHNLVNSFKGKEELNSAFINLTRTKIANINEELSLLEQLNVQKTNNPISESSLTSEITSTSSTKDNRAIAESSSEFVKAESNIETSTPLAETNQIEEKKITPTIEKTSVKDEIISSDKVSGTTSEEVSTFSEEISMREQDVANEADERVNDKQETDTENEEIKPESKDEKPAAVSNTSHKSSSKPKASASSKPNVLGEVINKDNSSVNDKLATQKEEVQDVRQIGKPVDDVRKAFGLNDRFYYQRELFNNKADLFNQTLEQINAMDSYQSAKEFLKANYNWSDDNQATESFFNSIKRRFI